MLTTIYKYIQVLTTHSPPLSVPTHPHSTALNTSSSVVPDWKAVKYQRLDRKSWAQMWRRDEDIKLCQQGQIELNFKWAAMSSVGPFFSRRLSNIMYQLMVAYRCKMNRLQGLNLIPCIRNKSSIKCTIIVEDAKQNMGIGQ